MATKTKPSGRVIGIPIDILITPRDGEVVTDRWWITRDGHALFWQAPTNRRGYALQCNRDKRIAESIWSKLYPDATITHIDVAYIGQWDEDFGNVLARDLLDAAVEQEWGTSPSTPDNVT